MKTLAIVFFTLSAALSLLGQATSGMPSFNVYSRGTYDQVNVANRSVMITVPVRSKAGPIPFSYSLVANPNVMKGLGNTYQLDSKFYGNSSTMVGPGAPDRTGVAKFNFRGKQRLESQTELRSRHPLGESSSLMMQQRLDAEAIESQQNKSKQPPHPSPLGAPHARHESTPPSWT